MDFFTDLMGLILLIVCILIVLIFLKAINEQVRDFA